MRSHGPFFAPKVTRLEFKYAGRLVWSSVVLSSYLSNARVHSVTTMDKRARGDHSNQGEGHLEKQFSRLTMVSMTFAILKYYHGKVMRISAQPLMPSQHLDLLSGCARNRPAFWWSSFLSVRLPPRRGMQPLHHIEPRRTCVCMANSRRPISLGICPCNRQMESGDGTILLLMTAQWLTAAELCGWLDEHRRLVDVSHD